MINTNKFHKIFNDGAIKQSHNTWWDAKTPRMVTKANQEMANILAFDTNLIFPKTKVELDMSGATTLSDTIAKIQDDLLLAGSISTF